MQSLLLFGDKKKFAIQLETHEKKEKCKLCFWVKEKKIGSFTKGGELKYSVKAFDKFSSNTEIYYNVVFKDMTPTDIRKYFADEMFVLMRSNKKDKQDEYERRKKMELFLGPQFSNDGTDIILLFSNNEVNFIYTPPKKIIAEKFIISYEYFNKVINEYISYCEKFNLL